MKYMVRTIHKIGVGGYENGLNKILAEMSTQGWKVQQITGDGAQGMVVLFFREK